MWEIYSYGGGDFLRMIFNGVASIFGNNDYYVALRISALMGFFGILCMVAFQKGALNINWILGIIIVIMVVVVPKKDLIITDRVVPANSSVVANVPLGLAFTAATFSKFGDWLTRANETVLSLPNEVKYSGNGLLFASHLVEESTQFEITTPRVNENFSDFWKSCVYYDLLLNLYGWDEVVQSTDIISFFKAKTSVTRSFTYINSSNIKSIINCRDGINNQLSDDITLEMSNSTNIQGARLVPNESTKSLAVARFASSMPVAYQYLTGMSMSNSRIISQNIMANSLKRGLSNFASEADASAAAQDFAIARAEAERKNAFLASGKMANRMLPIAQVIFEAFIYAMFPIVVILCMMPIAAKVAMGYVKALFWINMWAPLYAVLHFAVSYFSQKAASAAVVQAGGGFPTGLTVMTNTGLGHVLSDYAGIAGYLSLSIPMIAWMIVSSSGAMMASLAGRVMQSYDNPIAKASDEATGGNVNLGNVKYETSSAFQANASPSDLRGGVSVGDGVGNTDRISPHGGQIYTDVSSSTSPQSINYSDMTTNVAKASHNEATSKEESTGAKLAETNAAIRSEVQGISNRISKSDTTSNSISSSEKSNFAKAHENSDKVLEQEASARGLSAATAKAIAAELGGKAGAGSGFASVQAGIRAGTEGRVISQDDYKKALEAMSSQQYSEALRNEASAAHDLAVKTDIGSQDSRASDLNTSLSRQDQAMQEHSAAIKNVEQTSKAFEYSQQVGSQIQAKGDDGFNSWLSQSKHLSQDQIRQLHEDANKGGLENREAMYSRSEYAKEYVADQYMGYTQSQVNRDLNDNGSMNGNVPVFDYYDEQKNSIVEQGSAQSKNISAQGNDRANSMHSTETQNISTQSTAPSASDTNLIRSGAQDKISEKVIHPSTLSATMLPTNDDFKDNLESRSATIKNTVSTEQNRGALDRSVESVREVGESAAQATFDLGHKIQDLTKAPPRDHEPKKNDE